MVGHAKDVEEAVKALRKGFNTHARESVAEEIARKAGHGADPIHHDPHVEPGMSHYHAAGHPPGWGHSFYGTLKSAAGLVTATGLLEAVAPNNAYASGAGEIIDFFNPLSLPKDILDTVEDVGQILSGFLQPGPKASTKNNLPGTTTGALTENISATFEVWTGSVGAPITSADVQFTHTANSSFNLGATSVSIQPVPSGGQYDYTIYATVTFPEEGEYGVTVTVNGNDVVEDPGHEAQIVYDAPMIVNPVNFSVQSGGQYEGPVATFTDLGPDEGTGGYSAWTEQQGSGTDGPCKHRPLRQYLYRRCRLDL